MKVVRTVVTHRNNLPQLFIIFTAAFFVIVLNPREGGYSLSAKRSQVKLNSRKEPEGFFRRATLRGSGNQNLGITLTIKHT